MITPNTTENMDHGNSTSRNVGAAAQSVTFELLRVRNTAAYKRVDPHAVADPGFHSFRGNPGPFAGARACRLYNTNMHLQQHYTTTLDSKETSLPCAKFLE